MELSQVRISCLVGGGSQLKVHFRNSTKREREREVGGSRQSFVSLKFQFGPSALQTKILQSTDVIHIFIC